jgi:hypothetical protein
MTYLVKAIAIREGSTGKVLGWARVNPRFIEDEITIPYTADPLLEIILRNGVIIKATKFRRKRHGKLLFASGEEANKDGIERLKRAHEAGVLEPWRP